MIFLFVLTAVFLVFRSWFGLDSITSGDLSFFYPGQIRQYLNLPFAWETFRDAGLGGNSLLFQGVYLYNLPMGFLGQFLEYGVIERLIWFWPILIIGLISPFLLAKELNLFPSKFYPISSLIFLLNTYFLMIIGGGQLTVALAYIIIPLVLTLFLRAYHKNNLKNIIFFSLSLAFLIAWDFRFAYLLGIILGLYMLYFFLETIKNAKKYFIIFLITSFFVLGFHAFWLLPFLINYHNPIASFTTAFTTSEAVKFFSFADFSHAFSLLHPNWPENIFGKTYFMKWEFLMMPIIAYSSILFLKNSKFDARSTKQIPNNLLISFFAVLGLIGAFLAKGANEPFGEIYLWLFNHMPGMIMFRDPTKFYTMVALSYSILVPYSIWKIYEWISSKLTVHLPALPDKALQAGSQKFRFNVKNYLPNLFLLLATSYLLLLIWPAWRNQLGGTFIPKEVPKEYIELKNLITNQSEFFRTFWIPVKQRFTFYSNNHPAIDAIYFFNEASASGVVNRLQNKETEELLVKSGVKYIILPYDSEEELFLKDREYNQKQRDEIERELNNLSYLGKIGQFKLNSVYELKDFNDHFWLENSAILDRTVVNEVRILWKQINPTKYQVSIKDLKEPATIVFSENYDAGWMAQIGDQKIVSQKIYGRFNSFFIQKTGDFEILVEFTPQQYVNQGLIISLLTLLIYGVLLILNKIKLKNSLIH